MKVQIETLGCKVNKYESDAMAKLFEKEGYEIVKEGPAEIYIINTCTVTSLSARKSRQFISRARQENPQGLVAVVGCYPQTEPEIIENLDVDVVLGTQGRAKIVDFCEEALKTKTKQTYIEDFEDDKSFEDLSLYDTYNMTRAYLKIQEGCNQFCTYCIIPYARGPITSRDMAKILEEAKSLVDNGYKELVLTGIHVASYGKDLGEGFGLIEVIEKVSQIQGLKRLRLSSLEPRIIDRNFLNRLRDIESFCDHFHLSLQAGSDKILKKMNRKYSRDEYLEKISLIKEYFPNAGLTTDIMVGFPGETEEDFQCTLDMVDRVGFASVHIFRFSPRKGTPAASFKDQVPSSVKKDRAARLKDLADYTELKFLQDQVGRTHQVLFEKTYQTGHSKNYLKVKVDSEETLEGQIKDVIIKERQGTLLVGKLS